ncbi:hypothetical protein [Paludisphaera soli]|uniref:hypothetical protein n=1 Tax=Paludisphaera soli TaxID=2712865 RepID=UPI001980EF1A|nr:hypothetical protein [Paludisphaera soli]
MNRAYRPWLAAGLILTPLAATPAALAQASGQSPTGSVYISPIAGVGGVGAPLAYPRGYESPNAARPSGSPQASVVPGYGSGPAAQGRASSQSAVSTPYGVIPAPGASGQIVGGYGAGAPAAGAAGGMGGVEPYPGPTYGADAGSPLGGAGMGGAEVGADMGAGAGAGDGGGLSSAAAAAAAAAAAGAGPGAAGADAFEPALAGFSGPGGAGASESNFPPNMIGDMSPVNLRFARPLQGPPSVGPPPLPGARAAALFAPNIRTLKMSENQSPRPQDRFFYTFNYYSEVGEAQNIYDRSPVRNMEIFRHVMGFEKTFDEGRGSFGMRLPIETLSADSTVRGIQTPTSTATGNLSLFAKYILKQNVQTGSLASVGLALAPPTAPGRFAGAPYVFGMNNMSFQPFLGYIWNFGDFYLQGFSAFQFTSSSRDVTMMFNDIGIGYFLYRSEDPNAFLTAFVPNFEVHVNSPFTHRDWKNRLDPAGNADVVNLTYGLNFQFRRSALLSTALVTPVTGPRPFDAELCVYLNIFYGRSRAGQIPIQPPVF